MSSKLFARICAAALLAITGAANAASIVSSTSSLSGTIIDFNEYDGLSTTGPLLLNPEVVFTSVPNTLVGADQQDLDANGLWGARGNPIDGLVSTPTGNGNFVASAFVALRGELGFTFAAPVASVGAYFNQYQVAGVLNSMRLIAYDQYGNDLESFSYSVDTDSLSYNEGMFLGFSRTNADIYGFGIADGTFVLDDLTYSVTAVPEPAALALLLGGIGAVAARRKRKGS